MLGQFIPPLPQVIVVTLRKKYTNGIEENIMKSPINIEAFQRLVESDDQEGLLDAILRIGAIDDSEELSNAVRMGPSKWGSWSGWSW